MKNIARVSMIVTALLLASFFLATAAYAQTGKDAFSEGMQLYYQKSFKESQPFFLDALNDDPQNVMSISFYISAGYRANDLVKSVNVLEQKASEQGDTSLAKAQLGIGYFGRGLLDQNMMEEARNTLKESLTKNPDLAIANTGMGMIYYQKRLMPRAKGYFMKALKFNPGDLMALERLGEILMIDEKNPQAALEFFTKIINLAPGYCDGYFYAGSAYEAMGNKDEAISNFEKCMEIDKLGVLKGYDAPLRIGDIYLVDSRWDDAEKYYKAALAINPDNPYAKTQYAKAKGKGKEWKGEKINKLNEKIK